MKKITIVTICLIAASSAARPQQPNASSSTTTNVHIARESTPEVRKKTFEKVWETVRDKFFDPNFNGVDWNKLRERYGPLVDSVKTDDELYATLNRMLTELRISHMEIITPEALEKSGGPPVTTGLGLRNVEGRVVVLRVLSGSSAERAGFR